ncbi:hypothetical protein JOB18_045513 [Solea senegalensis]|uniref:Uncharacterized protein n=1 Tax=Solea senegalensis TaxID=28829 RepID=A0AAV6RLX9_SOLSE|nr:hypothetical protein JOB18_045513 [Solea senegalensis]
MKQGFSNKHCTKGPKSESCKISTAGRKKTTPPRWTNKGGQGGGKSMGCQLYDIEKVREIASQPMLQRLAEDNDIRQIDFAIREVKCDAVREKQIQEISMIKDKLSQECDYDYTDPNSINKKFWDSVDLRERERQESLLKEKYNMCKQYQYTMEVKKQMDLKTKMDKEEISKMEEMRREEDRRAMERKREVQKRSRDNINQLNSLLMQNKNRREEEHKMLDKKSLEQSLQYRQMKAENNRRWMQTYKEKEKERRARYESVVADLSQRTAADSTRKQIWRENGEKKKFHRIDEHKDKVLEEIKDAGVPDKLVYEASRKSNIIVNRAKASDPNTKATKTKTT